VQQAVDPNWVEWANKSLVSWPMMVILAALWLGLLGTTLWLRRGKAGDRAVSSGTLAWVGILGVPVVVELVLRNHTLSWVTYILVLLTWVLVIWHWRILTVSLTDGVLLLFSRKARQR